MLLQTNSYVVPKEKRAEHARLMRRFRQVLNRLGCDNFEVYEQVGANWSNTQTTGRFVQIMRFRDRKHQLAVQGAERADPTAQELIAEFCELVNYPFQQQQGQFAVGFYSSVLPVAPVRSQHRPGEAGGAQAHDAVPPEAASAAFGVAAQEPFGEAESTEFGGAQLVPMTEAEQEAAADEFVERADQHEGHDAAGESDANPAGECIESLSAPADQPDAPDAAASPDEPALPTLEAENPSEPAAAEQLPVEADERADAAIPPAADQAETPPAQPTAAENGEFSIDDLDAGEDADLTDDDLARLAEELAAEPPRHNGGGPGGHDPRRR